MDEDLEARIARLSSRPANWRAEGSNLLVASRILSDRWITGSAGDPMRLAFPALLLAGYAVENYAKGRIVALDPTRAQELNHHNLLRLVEEAGVLFDDFDRELLERLTEIVRWAGRYPAPRTPQGYLPGKPSPGRVSSEDFPRVEALCARLQDPIGSESSG